MESMASFGALSAQVGAGRGTRESFLFLRSSRDDAFCWKKERVKLKVKGTAKFKGTHMREKKLTEMIEEKVREAKEVCQGDETSVECKVAWDQVEEVSQAKADLRLKLQKQQDPLESFCHHNPHTDECRIYQD
ncbi:hypothetical protein CUMW_118480 [Citrus unshiu]|nr:hypothetical protein CUMW_118480 [Citrus unshiu]